MPYLITVNGLSALSAQDRLAMLRELDFLRAELNDIRTKYAATLAKLDADAGVTDTNYAALGALVAAKFNPTT